MVNLSFLEQFTKGNTAKMKRYITLYLEIAPQIFERMHTDLKNQNWSDLTIGAHSLKPQADFIGTRELKEILIQIENAVKNDETSKLPGFYENAYQIHQEVVVELSRYVESI